MAIPTSQATKAKLLEAIAPTNGDVPMVKFCIGWGAICMCLEDRIAGCDGSTLRGLLLYYRYVGEHHYPKLVDVVRGCEELNLLEAAFKRAS